MLKLRTSKPDIYVPDGKALETALKRITYLGVGAHPDDLEMMCASAIEECWSSSKKWFGGVVVTDGGGGPKKGLSKIRLLEQKRAARMGHYSLQVQLQYTSAAVKTAERTNVVKDLQSLFHLIKPERIFLHNLCDKHETHVAVSLCAVEALRNLSPKWKPKRIFGCEIWRTLDWMPDDKKICLEFKNKKNLISKLIACHVSQIKNAKPYSKALLGRALANSTFLESHKIGTNNYMTYAMDLTPLITDPLLSVEEYLLRYINTFESDVRQKVRRFSGSHS